MRTPLGGIAHLAIQLNPQGAPEFPTPCCWAPLSEPCTQLEACLIRKPTTCLRMGSAFPNSLLIFSLSHFHWLIYLFVSYRCTHEVPRETVTFQKRRDLPPLSTNTEPRSIWQEVPVQEQKDAICESQVRNLTFLWMGPHPQTLGWEWADRPLSPTELEFQIHLSANDFYQPWFWPWQNLPESHPLTSRDRNNQFVPITCITCRGGKVAFD